MKPPKKFAGGSYRDGLKTLAAELGYDLTLEDTSGELEMLSEYDLEQVSGGWDIPFCEFLLSIFGMDSEWYCEG